MNGRDLLSRYAQNSGRFQVDRSQGQWIEMLAFDKRASVPDQVTAKIDVAAWFSTLTQRMKEIARDLALGFSTSEVARKHELSASRISQIRRMLETSWDAFQGDDRPATA
jgi:DNA-binding NarL/FixJ family response regulator